MSTITVIYNITQFKEKGEIPDWVAKDLVGIEVGICSPQGTMCIGFKKTPGEDITDIYDAYAVEPEILIIALQKAGKKEAAEWFDDKFKFRHASPNSEIILINRVCCNYNP